MEELREKLKDLREKLEVRFPNFHISSNIIKGLSLPSKEGLLNVEGMRLVIYITPKQPISSDSFDELTNRYISVGATKFGSESIDELEKKVEHYVNLYGK